MLQRVKRRIRRAPMISKELTKPIGNKSACNQIDQKPSVNQSSAICCCIGAAPLADDSAYKPISQCESTDTATAAVAAVVKVVT